MAAGCTGCVVRADAAVQGIGIVCAIGDDPDLVRCRVDLGLSANAGDVDKIAVAEAVTCTLHWVLRH